MNKKGQIAVFVIIALVIVGGILVFFAFRDQLFAPSIPTEVKPVFDYYKQCIEREARVAIDLAGSQGGHVYVGPYIPGSDFAPFSSQLNFLGFPVPYWFYISGNGIAKESVPTLSEIQDEVSRYVEENVNADCNFDDFYAQGFLINLTAAKAKTTITNSQVAVAVTSSLVVSKDEVSAMMSSQSSQIASNFGSLYATATSIYAKEKSDAFLENYSVDVMRLYAPVDGVEISCSGKVWKTQEVVDQIKSGLEANVAAIKMKGNYYTATSDNKYFVVNLPSNNAVNMIYSKAWPTRVEIAGADNALMIAEPVGTQEGMGVMGFCYAPYHFVYDISYPVLIQVLEGQEVFQFPVVVVIDKNVPRQAVPSQLPAEEPEVDVCQYNTQDVEVNVYDNRLNRLNANISYICFNQRCDLGSTMNGIFSGKAPACVNGYIRATADGYAEKRQLFSSNEEKSVDMILDREYDVSLNLEVGGKLLEGMAMVTFDGVNTVSTALPNTDTIKLSEGLYNVTVYAYGNATLTIPGSTKTQCHDVSSGGLIGGLLGTTREECFDITIPETTIDSALTGGGKSEIYILPSDLEGGKVTLRVDELPKPDSLEQLQNNFEAFDGMGVELALT